MSDESEPFTASPAAATARRARRRPRHRRQRRQRVKLTMRMMSSILALALAVLWMTGCTAWTPTPVDPTLWQHKQMRIGVATARAPQASAIKGGSQGLLDVAV